MISTADAIRPATAAAMASSERRWAADVRAADSAFSVPRKSAKCLRIYASSNAPSCLTISVREAAGVAFAISTTGVA